MKLLLQLAIAVYVLNGAYAQTENFWTKKADFGGLKRERAVAFTIGDYGYVGTGVDTSETVLKDFWQYDPIMDTWTQVASLPGSQRRNAIAFAINGFGYVGTGMNTPTATEFGANTLDDFWQYDPALNSWTTKASFPGATGSGIYFATGVSIGAKGYICGGKRGPNNYVAEFWEYDPATDSWAQLPNFPGGVRYQLNSFAAAQKGYFGFGTDQDIYRKDIWEYDPATNQWTQKLDFPASERSALSTFTLGDRGYVCLGGNGGLLGDLWQYNPYNDSWSVKADYGGSNRKNAIAFAVNGKAYVGTGKGYSGKKASMYEYTPNTVLGVNDYEISVAVYPNPSSDFINLKYEAQRVQKIQLFSMTGQKLFEGESVKQIDIREFHSGNYILVAKQNGGSIVAQQNIIIQ
ncbi:MAG: kelch repeat-containing protein [Crocinitomicaceae bacterium]|nr:kelch repeat-containing protein [Crocinitomicaceae bacterium]